MAKPVNTMSAEEFNRRYGFAKNEPKRPKYRNEKQVVDGQVFDSKREASRYLELKLAEKNGRIKDLKLQYEYAIVIDGIRICDYVCDFRYLEMQDGGKWVTITEDAKGKRTREYLLKKKLMRAVHGIRIRET